MRVLLLLFLMLTALATAEPSVRYTNLKVKTLINNGPSSQKVDLVIVGDGYLAKELQPGGRFEKAAHSVLKELWTYNVFRDYKKSFNVHLIYLESKKSSHGKRYYALGSEIRDPRRNFVSLKRRARLKEVLSQAPAVDAAVVLTTMVGRSNSGHGRKGRIVLTERDTVVLAHELGHLLGGLGDEYSSAQRLWDRQLRPLPRNRDLRAPNLTLSSRIDPTDKASIAKTAKWGDLLRYDDAYPLISAHQGGYYNTVGVWRPSFECTMRKGRFQTFCPVCHKALVRKIYGLCGRTFDHSVYHRKHPYKNWR